MTLCDECGQPSAHPYRTPTHEGWYCDYCAARVAVDETITPFF